MDKKTNLYEKIKETMEKDGHYKSGDAEGAGTNKDLGRTNSYWQTGNYNLADETYVGHTRFFMRFPSKEQLKNSPEKFILSGLVPKSPFITKKHNITTLGSCFAEEIVRYLSKHGFDANSNSDEKLGDINIYFYGAGLFNSFAVRQQFEWTFENKSVSNGTWYDLSGNNIIPSEELRKDTLRIFQETNVFIITFGMAEVWENRKTGEVAWRKISTKNSEYESNDFGFRISTCAENVENMERIYQLIRKYNPKASIIFTVSPVALRATWRDIGSVPANMVSKGTLRVAVDEVWRSHRGDENFFYFPSYEIIKELCPVIGMESYQSDNRHPPTDSVLTVMELFKKFFISDAQS